MQTDLAILRERVLDAAEKSPIGDELRSVTLGSDRDNEGGEFLRVILRLRHVERADDLDLAFLLEEIENTIDALDERYPSVRFSDAE